MSAQDSHGLYSSRREWLIVEALIVAVNLVGQGHAEYAGPDDDDGQEHGKYVGPDDGGQEHDFFRPTAAGYYGIYNKFNQCEHLKRPRPGYAYWLSCISSLDLSCDQGNTNDYTPINLQVRCIPSCLC